MHRQLAWVRFQIAVEEEGDLMPDLLDSLEEGLCIGAVVDTSKGRRAQQEQVQKDSDGKVEAQEVCQVLDDYLAEEVSALCQVACSCKASPRCPCQVSGTQLMASLETAVTPNSETAL